jgi:formate hydrogenlyase subunit 3/multisubunit Na+/H+ antiporter MnhD subunit
MGIAFAGNLLTFYVFYEMLTISTYPLVTHNETEEAVTKIDDVLNQVLDL